MRAGPRLPGRPLVGLSILAALVVAGLAAWAVTWTNDESRTSGTGAEEVSASDGLAEVRFEVTGTAVQADLTLSDGSGSISQQADVDVPVRMKDGRYGITFEAPHGNFVQLSAQNQGDSGTITCRIVADGQVVDEVTSRGGYVIASCQATV